MPIKTESPAPTPPPQSQSHFAKFENFTPNPDASFDDEFNRLASSQQWIPGSQAYTQERTIAMREEIKTHYFPSTQDTPKSPEQVTLEGHQALCREVGIPPQDSLAECRRRLKKTLVNIVDLIDARRTSKEVEVWRDFEAFRDYTLKDEHRISMGEAKKDGILEALLQRLRGGRRRRRRIGASRVLVGRVTKDTKAKRVSRG